MIESFEMCGKENRVELIERFDGALMATFIVDEFPKELRKYCDEHGAVLLAHTFETYCIVEIIANNIDAMRDILSSPDFPVSGVYDQGWTNAEED